MVVRVRADDPSVETLRATVLRHGGDRRRIELPRPIHPDERGEVRAVVDGRTRVAAVDRIGGSQAIVGLFATLHAARSGDPAADRLGAWLERVDRGPGSSIAVDVLEWGDRVGLRQPGDRAVYDAAAGPEGDLASIARSIADR